MLGLAFIGWLMGGSVVVEQVFSLPGLNALFGRHPRARPVEAPYYGDALFHFFQDRYFTSITTLMASQHFDRVAAHRQRFQPLAQFAGQRPGFGLARDQGIGAAIREKGFPGGGDGLADDFPAPAVGGFEQGIPGFGSGLLNFPGGAQPGDAPANDDNLKHGHSLKNKIFQKFA